MMNDLEKLVEEARARFDAVADEAGLADAKAAFLGKSGALTALLKGLASLTGAEKAERGKALNQVKQRIEAQLNARIEAIRAERLAQRLASERLDVSLPGRGAATGGLHPVTLTIERVEQIFRSIGFDVADGPEIEEDYFNFTALNIPPNHPARSMADTFYIERPAGSQADASAQPLVLRTHTSPMQVRYARMNQAPLKVIVPGKTYRVDSDATHSPMFHQVEGLWVDENISFADGPLKGRWLEVSGSGQVHPNVVRNLGLDPEKHIGFAFGSGIERLAMLRYGVDDLRLFYENDLRFLRQFA